MEELIVYLRIEKDNRNIERKSIVQFGTNFVETDSKVVNKKHKISNNVLRKDNSKNAKKFKDNCYNYEKVKNHSNECRKSKKTAQTNAVEIDTLSEGVQEMSLSVVVFECNTVVLIDRRKIV